MMDMSTSLEQLAQRARAGNEAAFDSLSRQFEGFIRFRAQRYFLAGGTIDDLKQEARIGLWKAVRDWREDGQSSFRTFAGMCIERQMITAVKTATRGKHSALNGAVSLHASPAGLDDARLEDVIPDGSAGIVERLEAKERLLAMLRAMSEMTRLEQRALWLVEVSGVSYDDAALELGISVKGIDNAVQRARRKLDIALLPVVCDICENEIAAGSRCGPCEEEIEWARQFVAA